MRLQHRWSKRNMPNGIMWECNNISNSLSAKCRTQQKLETSDARCCVSANWGSSLSINQGFLDPPDFGTKQELLKTTSYKGSPDIHAAWVALPILQTFINRKLSRIQQPLHSTVCPSNVSSTSLLPPLLARLVLIEYKMNILTTKQLLTYTYYSCYSINNF